MKNPVIVIGAGIAGLSAAIHLAAAGLPVRIMEQNASVGGKMSEARLAGFRWDTGPSVITMRPVLADLFAAAGRQLETYLDLRPVEPLTRYFYADGTVLNATAHLPSMLAQIEALDRRDVEGYLAYLAYAARLHRITGPTFIYETPPTWRSFLRVPPHHMLQVDALRTMDAAIRSYVRSPYLRQLLGRFATYVGASPYLAPATLNVIAHMELSGGVWYPQGGVYTIARALANLARELGVKISTHCRVHSIVVEGDVVQGVATDDGRLEPASTVIANIDVTTVYQKLLPPRIATSRRLAGLTGVEPSCSGFILLLGVEGEFPGLAHHNIFFSGDYRGEFEAIFGQGAPPAEPTIYVAITSRSDPGHAPPGCENWFVLVNAPPVGPGFNWEQQASAYRERVLARLAAFGFDVRGRIRAEQMYTPPDLARQTGAWRGALYGLSSNNMFTAFRRPSQSGAGCEGPLLCGWNHPSWGRGADGNAFGPSWGADGH
jgi:phytoene desaturase